MAEQSTQATPTENHVRALQQARDDAWEHLCTLEFLEAPAWKIRAADLAHDAAWMAHYHAEAARTHAQQDDPQDRR